MKNLKQTYLHLTWKFRQVEIRCVGGQDSMCQIFVM